MGRFRGLKTLYNTTEFRSKTEAKWAVVFDAMGFDWHYEPEGFSLGNGKKYAPDFSIWNVEVEEGEGKLKKHDCLYVEVKGARFMQPYEWEKIKKFSDRNTLLVLNDVPKTFKELTKRWRDRILFDCDNPYDTDFDNFRKIHFDGPSFKADYWDKVHKAYPYDKDRNAYEEINPDHVFFSVIDHGCRSVPMYPQIRDGEAVIGTPEIIGTETFIREFDEYQWEDEYTVLGIGKQTLAAFTCGNSAKFDHGLTMSCDDVKKKFEELLEK